MRAGPAATVTPASRTAAGSIMASIAGRMAGKRAIVTGAANGIGRAICLAFAAEGGRVLACDINDEGAAETLRLSGLGPGDGVAQVCDVARSADCQAVVAAARTTFGGIDVLVNNAAWFMPRQAIADVSEEDWAKNMAVNIDGPFLMSRHAVPVMAAGGGGSIVHVASQMARVANEGQTSYCTAKGALLMLAKGMAVDHAKDNIRCNTLSPGGIATQGMIDMYGGLEQAEEQWGRPMHVLGRLGKVEEVAAGAVFLASDESSFMTGTDLLIDGGYTAR